MENIKYILDEEGNEIGVILPIDEYNKLLELEQQEEESLDDDFADEKAAYQNMILKEQMLGSKTEEDLDLDDISELEEYICKSPLTFKEKYILLSLLVRTRKSVIITSGSKIEKIFGTNAANVHKTFNSIRNKTRIKIVTTRLGTVIDFSPILTEIKGTDFAK